APVCGPSLVCDTNVGCTCQDFGVVVSTNCNGSLEQSPSPKNREKNACVNSKFNVRFNSEIAPLPFQAIKLEECNDSTCAGASLTPIALDILPRVSSSQFLPPVPDTIQAVLPPGTLLNPDTWHRVTIREGPTGVVTAITSIEMPEDFGWIFKTKDDPAPCVASRCALDPRKGAEVEKIGDTYAFTLTEVFGSCNLITTDTPYDVVSSDNAIATVAPTPINIVPPAVTTATAVAKGRIDVITTNQVNPVVTCKANFTVDTQVPKVVERYPDCITACTNATIGARFNLGVLKTDLTPGGTINLFSCGTDPTCGVRVPVAIDPVLIFVDDPAHAVPPPNLYTTQVSFGSVVPLNEDEYYQVELNAGSIFGASGESLKENTTGGLYQWVFKTKISDGSGLCSVDHINVAPGEITARVTGISHAFTGEAYSAPDECSVRGQRLVATNFNWSDPASPAPYFGWAPPNTPPQVGFIDTPLLDINPADSSTDPVQNFITDGTDPACNSGVCSTTVVATVEPGGGEPAIACTDAGSECGIVNLRCGYQRDEQCSEVPPIGIGLGAGYGVSYTSCCSARPQIDFGLTNPTDGEKNFCRNGVAKVVFNKAIDTASISGNIFLVKNVKSGICPVGLRSLLVKNDSSTHFVRIAPPEGLMNKVVYYIEKFFSSIFGTKADAAYVAGNLCLVPANIILRTDGSGVRNEVHITPRSLLDITAGGQEYAIVILGDTDPLDGEKVGVRSKDGVTFVGTTPFDRAGKSFMS
ncbi:MAG: hypothetical protein QGH83_14910, partial [Candidatus Pacebacteria bacterium]|nr:hypothetical protein [Candidatus Paceibacterota bacterium]